MSLKKRVGGLALAVLTALGLAACGASSEGGGASALSTGAAAGEAVAMGRWIEQTALELPSDMSATALLHMDDGSVLCLARSGASASDLRCYRSVDQGAAWQEETPSWAAALPEMTAQVLPLADSSALVSQIKEPKDPVSYMLDRNWYRASDGDTELTPFEFPDLKEGEGVLSAYGFGGSMVLACVGEAQDGIAQPTRAILVDAATGEKAADCDTSAMSASSSDGFFTSVAPIPGTDSAYVLCTGADYNSMVMRMEKDGSVEPAAAGLDGYVYAIGAAADGACYQIGPGGLVRTAAGATKSERLCEGSAYTFAQSDGFVSGLLALADGSVLAEYNRSSGEDYSTVLLRYVYDETVPTVPEDTLTVWMLEASDTVSSAVAQYVKLHPEANVVTHAALEEGYSSAEDALMQLNTELLAGKGPDVLILDGLDYASYIEKGLLADLNGVIPADGLVENIRRDFVGDSTYVLPVRWSMPVILGDTEDTRSLTTLDALRNKILACPARPAMNAEDDAYYRTYEEGQRYAFSFPAASDLLDFVYDTSAPALIRDGAVNEDALRQMLDFISQVGPYNNLKGRLRNEAANGAATSGGGGLMVAFMDRTYEYAMTHGARYGWDDLSSLGMLGDIMLPFDTETGARPEELIVLTRAGLCEGAYRPSVFAAVNSSSPNRDAALELVGLLLSSEVQAKSYASDGLPVLQSSLDAQIASLRGENGEAVYKDDVHELLAQAQTPVVRDNAVYEKLLVHAGKLCDGTETVEQAVSALVQELGLYLAERQ